MLHGLAAISPVPSVSHVTGDTEILQVESDNGNICSLSTAAGFAAVTGGQAVVGTGPSTASATMTLFWRRWNGSDGTPTVADTGNHQSAFVTTYQDVIATGDPFEAVTTSTQASPGTGGVAAGGTTSVNDTLVAIHVAQAAPDLDADPSTDLSGWTNANLTSLTEQKEYSCSDGNGGLGALATGIKATAGAIGNTTFTSVQTGNGSTRAMVTLALLPVPSAAVYPPRSQPVMQAVNRASRY